jgi:hypothetical protein
VAAQFDYREDGSLSSAMTYYVDGTLESKFVYRRDGTRKAVRIYRPKPENSLETKVAERRDGSRRYVRRYWPDGTLRLEDTYRADGSPGMRYVYERDGTRTALEFGAFRDRPTRDVAATVRRDGSIARRGGWLAIAAAGLAFGFGFSYWEGRYPAYNGRDLDCADIGHQVRVGSSDPHGLDRDGDGVGCEAERATWQGLALLGFGIAAAGGWGAIRAFQDA